MRSLHNPTAGFTCPGVKKQNDLPLCCERLFSLQMSPGGSVGKDKKKNERATGPLRRRNKFTEFLKKKT